MPLTNPNTPPDNATFPTPFTPVVPAAVPAPYIPAVPAAVPTPYIPAVPAAGAAIVNITGVPPSQAGTPPSPGPSPDPVPAFPESAWCGAFVDYYNLVCETTKAPEQLIWAAFAGVLSALASMCISLRFGPGVVRPILFLLLMGDTATTRKTTAINDAVAIGLDPLQPRGAAPGEPDPFFVQAGQGSGEGLMEVLADQAWWPLGVKPHSQPPNIQTGRSGIYVFDEYGAFLEKAARDQAGNFLGFHLNLFDCSPKMTLTTGSTKLVCTNARATILAASTTDYLARTISEGMVWSGFINRFLFFTGRPGTPIPIRPPVDEAARTALVELLRGYMDSLRGREMTFGADARQVNHDRYVANFYGVAETPLLAAATDRSHIQAIRLAMILAFAEGSAVITGQHMTAAWDVTANSSSVVAQLLAKMKSKDFEAGEKKMLRAARKLAAVIAAVTRPGAGPRQRRSAPRPAGPTAA